MFKYKLVCDEEFINKLKREKKGSLLKAAAILIGAMDILFLLLISSHYIMENEFNIVYFVILVAFIIIGEAIALIRYSSEKTKHIAEGLKNTSNTNTTMNIDESGISLYKDNLLKHIAWSGIKEVRVNDKEITFYYKVNGIVSNIFYFDFFDASKDEIIDEVEKYKSVRSG